jgi:toxin ParE2
LRVRFLATARQEFREAVLYYNAQRAWLGSEFRDEVKATTKRIVQQPLAWHLMGGNIRRCQTRRFPYGIIYEPLPEEIIVIAVAHLHRQPDFWNQRKP